MGVTGVGTRQLRLAIIQATGFMAETMEREQFDAQLPKIITGILAAYKKDKIHLPITQVGASATVLPCV